MSQFHILRTDQGPPAAWEMDVLRRVLLGGFLDGHNEADRRSWRRLWGRIFNLDPGEILSVGFTFDRSGPFHRRVFKILNTVFDHQDQIGDPALFLDWLKIGSGWVEWMPGPDGSLCPVPKSVSYAAADQAEFERFWSMVREFLYGDHCPAFLWPHLSLRGAREMRDTLLRGFE